MPGQLTCPRGHQWQSDFDRDAQDATQGVACPVWGAVVPSAGRADPSTASADDAELPPVQADEQVTPVLPSEEGAGDGPTVLGRPPKVPPPAPTAPPATAAIPGYEILGELGRGGMG